MCILLLRCWRKTTYQVPHVPWFLTGPTETAFLASYVCGAAARASDCTSAALMELEHRLLACLLQALTEFTLIAVSQLSLRLYTCSSRQVQANG